jgi:hypothetical protein
MSALPPKADIRSAPPVAARNHRPSGPALAVFFSSWDDGGRRSPEHPAQSAHVLAAAAIAEQPRFRNTRPLKSLRYTTCRRRPPSITRAPCRKVVAAQKRCPGSGGGAGAHLLQEWSVGLDRPSQFRHCWLTRTLQRVALFWTTTCIFWTAIC